MIRNVDLGNKNIFISLGFHFIQGDPFDPQFLRHHNRPSWSLTEVYFKFYIVLFKPLSSNVNSLMMDDNFSTALEAFMWDPR